MQHEFRRYWTTICHLGVNMRLLLAGAALLGLGNGIFMTFFNLYLKQGGLGEAFLGRLNSLGTIGSPAESRSSSRARSSPCSALFKPTSWCPRCSSFCRSAFQPAPCCMEPPTIRR